MLFAYPEHTFIYKDSKCVMKVVRYGINLTCFPDEKAVKLIEQHIAREKQDLESSN